MSNKIDFSGGKNQFRPEGISSTKDSLKPYSRTYTNATGRTGATGLILGDVGTLALQTDNNSLWMLTDDSPVTWKPLGSTGPTGYGRTGRTGRTGTSGSAGSVEYVTRLSVVDVDLVDDTDFTALETEMNITEGVGYNLEIAPSTAVGLLTIELYQDTARLEVVFSMSVDLSDATTYRSAEAFGFKLETAGTLYGTVFVSGVGASETVDILVTAVALEPTTAPTGLPSPYGQGIEDDGTGKARVALVSTSGLNFNGADKLVIDPDATYPVYPAMSASGVYITGAVTTTTDEDLACKKRFHALGMEALAAAGAPTAGTYLAGHEILDLNGIKWRCTGAGTPGTWEMADNVYEEPDDAITGSLTYGTSELLEIPVTGNMGIIHRMHIFGVVAAVAENSIPFRVRIFETQNERGREMCWQGNGLARQTNLSAAMSAGVTAVPVHDNSVGDVDEAIVLFEDGTRYELGLISARPTGKFTLSEAMVYGSSWADESTVAIATTWYNVPFANLEASAADQQIIYLQIRHDGISTDPAITFYVQTKVMSMGVLR